jgi:hypothetical protein
MTQYVDAEALLADVRRKKERTDELARRARLKLGARTGSRRPSNYNTDGMTAEEIERDTRAINKVMAVWRAIGKTTPSPLTLPSGRTIVPKRTTTEGRGRTEYAVPRRRRRKGAKA